MSYKTKICFILSHFTQGGAERQTFNLIKGLNPELFEITLLIYQEKKIFYKDIYNLPIKIVVNEVKYKYKIQKIIKIIFFLRKFLKKNNFDLIHTLLFHNGFWVRIIAPRKYDNKIVYSIRNNLKDGSKFLLFFEKILVRKSVIVTNSKQSKLQILNIIPKKYKRKVIHIYNGIDILRFSSDKPASFDNEIVMGNVGRLTTQKNQMQILEVINKIRNNYKISFYLIGNKEQDKADEIIKYIKTNELGNYVTLLGAQQEIEKYYKTFNIFILSSLYEGCPNVLFEAMLSRCLCIVSEGANSDEFVIDGYNGLVYNGENEMLEKKLQLGIELIQSNKANQIINNGYNFASSNFSLSNMIHKYELLYSDLLKNEK